MLSSLLLHIGPSRRHRPPNCNHSPTPSIASFGLGSAIHWVSCRIRISSIFTSLLFAFLTFLGARPGRDFYFRFNTDPPTSSPSSHSHMDPNARLPPISSGTSDGPNYRLPSISNLVNVASEPLDPPRQPPEPPHSRLPPISQQRHVKQHPESLPNSSSTTHHNPALPTTGPELPYAPPASPLEQFRPGGRETHPTREMEPPRGLESPPTQPWSLPHTRHTTTGTYAGPSTFHSSAHPSRPSERAVMWSHHSYSARPDRASYPSHQNEPPVSAPHSSADSLGSSSQQMLPSFASTFGPPPARPAARISESRQDGPQITVARSREFENSRPTASYPPDLRRESQIPQADSNTPVNTIGTHALPIHRTAPSNYTSQPTIQFGLPQHYEFRPFERPGFSRESLAPRTQPGRNATVQQQPHPGHHTAGTQDRGISGGQLHRPPSPPISLSRSTTTAVASSHAHGYPVGDWRADYNGSHGPAMSHSMSNPRSSVPASSSRSIHAPPTLPTQPNSRPVPSHPHSYESSIPLGHGVPGPNSVSPQRPSRGRGSRGRQQGPKRVRSDLASDATRASSQPRKRPRRNMEKAFDPTAIARPPPMITITTARPSQPHTGTGGVPGGTPGGLQPMGAIPPRPKRLILQTGPEDLPRVEELLTKESNEAAARNKHMKKARPETCFGLISVARLADRMGILPF